MSDIEEILEQIRTFNSERDWDQFHNAKDLAISLSLEAAELLEVFQWTGEKTETDNTDALKEELADVLMYCFQLADHLHLDIAAIMKEKLVKNAMKYPKEKAYGKADKYTAYKEEEICALKTVIS